MAKNNSAPAIEKPERKPRKKKYFCGGKAHLASSMKEAISLFTHKK